MNATDLALLDNFSYDPETGLIQRLKVHGSRKPGEPVGKTHRDGHLTIKFSNQAYFAHRLAWFLHYREWPAGNIDHRDGDPQNNRITNLRLASNRDNCMNLGVAVNNTSGVTGVIWNKKDNKWQARIKVDRKQKHLGQFDTIFDAVACRRSAECRLGFSPLHGQRPSYQLSALIATPSMEVKS